MKLSRNSSLPLKLLAATALLVAGCVLPAPAAVNVLVSGTSAVNDQPLINFLTSNFQDVTVTYGNFSDYAANAATIEAADVFMVGRSFSSLAYANAGNSASFNALTIPVVAFSSFLTRPLSGRWGWHSGDTVFGASVVGAETTVTAAGATVFGVAEGAYDWYPGGGGFNAAGSGTVGDGQILATIAGEIMAAHWSAGDLSGTGVVFGGERLLFNLSQVGPATIMPIGAGQDALITALTAFTPCKSRSPAAWRWRL